LLALKSADLRDVDRVSLGAEVKSTGPLDRSEGETARRFLLIGISGELFSINGSANALRHFHLMKTYTTPRA
jgi:hypothetical protein